MNLFSQIDDLIGPSYSFLLRRVARWRLHAYRSLEKVARDKVGRIRHYKAIIEWLKQV